MIRYIRYELNRYKQYRRHFLFFIASFLLLCAILFHFAGILPVSFLSAQTQPLHTQSFETVFEPHLFCNDQPNTTVFQDLITSHIRKAQKSIEIAMYSFDYPEIYTALLEASQRGVKIEVIMDHNAQREFYSMSHRSAPFVFSFLGKKQKYMHHKFALFDAATPHPSLLLGSYNYTKLQEQHDPSCILEIKNSAVIDEYSHEFHRLQKGKSSHEKFFVDSYVPFENLFTFKNGFFEVWFSPGTNQLSIKKRILELIHKAKKSIDVYAWRFNDMDIASALMKKAAHGIPVRIIADDFYFWAENSVFPYMMQYLSHSARKNMEIISDFPFTIDQNEKDSERYFNPYLHKHTLIVDNQVVLNGTNNWSYGGFFANDESIFVTDIDHVVKGFSKSFNNHYNLLHKNNLKLTFKNNELLIQNKNLSYPLKLSVYLEKSETRTFDPPCFETDLSSNRVSDFPKSCLKPNALFILKKDNDIVATQYEGWELAE